MVERAPIDTGLMESEAIIASLGPIASAAEGMLRSIFAR